MPVEATPRLTMNVASALEADELRTTVTLEGLGEPYAGSATASVTRRDARSSGIAFELSVVRALQALQHEIMERVHERIDRATDDV